MAVKGKDLTTTPDDHKTTAEVLEKNKAAHAPLDDDEPTTEEFVEMLRESIEDVKAGRTRPAREAMRELREMLAREDDTR